MTDDIEMDQRVPDPPDLVRFNEVSKIHLGPNDVLLVKIPVPNGMPPKIVEEYFQKASSKIKRAFAEVGRPDVPVLISATGVIWNIIEAVGSLENLPPCHLPADKNVVEFEPRLCEYEGCRLPLPSGWVAVYCSVQCATWDAD